MHAGPIVDRRRRLCTRPDLTLAPGFVPVLDMIAKPAPCESLFSIDPHLIEFLDLTLVQTDSGKLRALCRDGGTGRRSGLKIRRWQHRGVRFPPGTRRPMNFCSNCGQKVELKGPAGDHLPRFVCPGLRDDPLSEPEDRRRVRPGLRGSHPDVPPRHQARAAASGPSRRASWRTARPYRTPPAANPSRKPWPMSRSAPLLSVVHVLHADQVHVTFRARLPRPVFGVGRRASRWFFVRKPSSVAGDRLPERRFRAPALRRGSSRRCRGASFHDHRPAPPRR